MSSFTRYAHLPTEIDELLLVARGDELVGLYFSDHQYPPAATAVGERVGADDDPVLSQAARELQEYFAGERTVFEVPHRGTGSAFDERVWQILDGLPYGSTTTYGRIAGELGGTRMARRVGYAVGHNPISIIVACHRVLGANGGLTGYAGGLDRKRRLLDLERSTTRRDAESFDA